MSTSTERMGEQLISEKTAHKTHASQVIHMLISFGHWRLWAHTCTSSVSVVLISEEPRGKLLSEQNGNEWCRLHSVIQTLQTHYPATQNTGTVVT